jgi:general secretion pathway protein M
MIENLIKWWRTLALRERRMVGVATVVVALAIGYLLLFEPAWRGRKAIEADLPAVRAKVSQMDALANEARQLATVPQVDETPQVLRRQLEQSLAAAGLKEYVTQINLNGSVIDVRFAAAPFAAWVLGIDAALRETRLRVIDAALTRDAVNGTASGKLALEGPRRDAR